MRHYHYDLDMCTGYETLLAGHGEDTVDITTITEPEDRTFGRDLSPVVDELNRLHALALTEHDHKILAEVLAVYLDNAAESLAEDGDDTFVGVPIATLRELHARLRS